MFEFLLVIASPKFQGTLLVWPTDSTQFSMACGVRCLLRMLHREENCQ